MKKAIALFMAQILIWSLFACTVAQSEVPGAGESQTPTWQEQYDLGIRCLSEGNYEEAIIAFTAAIDIDPKQAPAYVGRGDAYVLSGETKENLTAAKMDYEKAIELDQTSTEAYLGLADVYIRQRKYEKALEILLQGLKNTNNAEDIKRRIHELTALNLIDYSSYITDSLISDEDLTIGHIPFYELSIQSAIGMLPPTESSISIQEIPDLDGNISMLMYTVVRDHVGIISCEQRASSKTLYRLSFGDYCDNTFRGINTGIRNIQTGDAMEIVLTKVGISSDGAAILSAIGSSMYIGADHTISGGYGWLNTTDFVGSVHGIPSRTITIEMDTCTCQMDFIDGRLAVLLVATKYF